MKNVNPFPIFLPEYLEILKISKKIRIHITGFSYSGRQTFYRLNLNFFSYSLLTYQLISSNIFRGWFLPSAAVGRK